MIIGRVGPAQSRHIFTVLSICNPSAPVSTLAKRKKPTKSFGIMVSVLLDERNPVLQLQDVSESPR
jgi:hypothetical protein